MLSSLSTTAARVKGVVFARRGLVRATPSDEQFHRWSERLWDLVWVVLTLLVLCESRLIAVVATLRTTVRARLHRRRADPNS